uniref:Patched domain-containing protein 2-like n=1 Tax=Saccoglossus kowalevskii TaxID=10224 RepID=A0ABM0M2B2_SACKO|nr:PREDICTED: patched domain-containing protein 2-like [Saccoglossus kowalevskii]
MAFTIKTAGMATLFTSFTTAAAFAANTASQIPAIHDFGLFMALVVSFCWFYVVLLMPPVLTIWHFAFEKCETFCYLPCTNDVVSGPNGNPYRIFSTGQQQPHSINHGTTLDDVQMLDMEDIDTNDLDDFNRRKQS